MRAALYARYSSDLQRPTSIEDQLRDCRTHAARLGWEIVEVFTDYEISGTTMNRPGLQAMIAAAGRRSFDIVLIEDLDRLSRDLGDTANLRKELEFNDVKLHTLVDQEVQLIHVAFKGLKNAQMIEDLGRKLRRAQRGMVDKGLAAGGLSYGYDLAPTINARGDVEKGKRRINEAEAATIRRIFYEYVSGVSITKIVERLNAEGTPTPGARVGWGDGKWGMTTIVGNLGRGNGILHNRLYVGEIVYNRTRKVRNPRSGKRLIRLNPESEWRIIAVPELRIVDDDTWHAVQAIKARNGGLTLRKANRRPKHLFSGIIECGVCGGTYAVYKSDRMACSSHRVKKSCLNTCTINTDVVEDRVLSKLHFLMARPKAVAAFVKEYNRAMREQQSGQSARRREAEKKLNDYQQKAARLLMAIEDGGDSKIMGKRMAELEAEIERLRGECAANTNTVVQLYPDAHIMYARKMEDLAEALKGDVVERAQAMTVIRSLVGRLRLVPDKTSPNGLAIEVEGKLRGLLELANQPAKEPSKGLLIWCPGTGSSYTAPRAEGAVDLPPIRFTA